MNAKTGRLRRILEREVAVHRELLRLARSRNVLLTQGRFEEAADLAVLEAVCIVTLRDLEAGRSRLGRPSTKDPTAARSTRQIAVLVRGLGAVERANRALWAQRELSPVLASVASGPAPAGAYLN